MYRLFFLWLLPSCLFGQKPDLIVPVGYTGTFSSGTFSPDGRSIFSLSDSNAVMIWELEANEIQTLRLEGNSPISAIALAPDGQQIITGDAAGTLTLWDRTGKALQTYPTDEGRILSVVFAPDGQSIASGSTNGEVHLWDFKTEVHRPFPALSSTFFPIAFSPDGQSILTGGFDGTARLWDLQGRELQIFKGHTNLVTSIAFAPVCPDHTKCKYVGHQTILTGSVDGTAKLWDLNGKLLQTFSGHTRGVTSVAFSPPCPDDKDCQFAPGQAILTGSKDNTAKLWTIDGQEVHTFQKHTSFINTVEFSPDGQRILTSGQDHKGILWSTANYKELATLINIPTRDWVVTAPSGLFDVSTNAGQLMHYSFFYEQDFEYEVLALDQLKARYYEPGLLPKVLGLTDEKIRPVENFESVKLYPKLQARIDQDSLYIDLQERNGGIGKVSIFVNGKEVEEEANPLPRRENPRRKDRIRRDLSQKKYQNFMFRHPDSTNTISIRVYNEDGWLKSRAENLSYRIHGRNARGNESDTLLDTDWVGQFQPKLYVIAIGTSDYAGTQLDLQYADQDAAMMARAMHAVGTALYQDSLEVHCLTTAPPDSVGLTGTPINWQFSQMDHIAATFKNIQQKAKAEDVIVVYLSGHGIAQSGQDETQFYYLTGALSRMDELADPGTRRKYTISSDTLTSWINDIPALKQVIVIDACGSGQLINNLTGKSATNLNSSQIRALDRMQDRTGIFVLCGSASNKVSYEAGEYGQGLLTYALLEGMRNQGTRMDTRGQLLVDVMELFQYARDRVPVLASTINGVQKPMLGVPDQAASFDLGILNDSALVHIPFSNKKPVMIRSNFLNEITLDDDLGLVSLLENQFRKKSSKGANADLIYVDVNQYPGAYSLKGFYQKGKAYIDIKVKLFRQGTSYNLNMKRCTMQDPEREIQRCPTEDPDTLANWLIRAAKQRIDALNE